MTIKKKAMKVIGGIVKIVFLMFTYSVSAYSPYYLLKIEKYRDSDLDNLKIIPLREVRPATAY
jgi:hypothetical protein